MKFYGIDAQGYIKVQQAAGTSVPAFAPASDERRILYVDTGSEDHVYLGGDRANDWVRVVLDDGATYPTLNGVLSAVYHPVGGDSTVSFEAANFTGSGDDNLRVLDNWIKLSDNTPITTGGTAGIRIEYGNIGLEVDDITISYVFDAPLDGIYPTNWQLNNGGYTNDPIATHDWVSGQINLSGTSTWTKAEANNRFVRWENVGDVPQNTSWIDWLRTMNDAIGDVVPATEFTACRNVYRKNEIYNGYVRSQSAATENNPIPANRPIYSTSVNTALTVVERDANSDIWCDILHGQATSAQYADLAEKYTCDETLPVGTVVEVSDDTDEEVVPCMFELSPSVVGVVSRNPAHLMNSESAGLPIALTGKVEVRVIGEVRKGDFIVPAGDGLARKGDAGELAFKIGVVLKTDLQTDEKLVECIIK